MAVTLGRTLVRVLPGLWTNWPDTVGIGNVTVTSAR